MIRLLTGTIVETFGEGIILDVQGVGYEIWLGPQARQQLLVGQTASLPIYCHVRQDVLQLFGFLDTDQRQLFTQLLAVSGVGPKSALQITDRGGEAVRQALRASNVAFFQSIPRLGKKTAQKIIVELQSKFGATTEWSLPPIDSIQYDVREALLGLGYSEAAIQAVLPQLEQDWPLAQAIKFALKQLGSKHG